MKFKTLYSPLLITLLSCIILAGCGEKQAPYSFEVISETSEEYPDQTNRFPILTGGNSEITQKVNSALTQEFLDLEYGEQEKSIFEKIWPDPESFSASTIAIDFEVLSISDKAYNVIFKGESCGAYCEEFTRYFTFDLTTGEQVKLENLFTAEGRESVIAQLIKFKQNKLDGKIAEADSALSTANLSEQDQVYYEDMRSIYMGCFMDYSSLEYMDYMPTNDSLAIKIDRCAPHVVRYADELGEMHFKMAIADLKGALSEIGHKVLK